MKYLLSAYFDKQSRSYSLCLFDEVDQFTSAVTPPERLDLDDKFHVLLKEGIVILQVLQKNEGFLSLTTTPFLCAPLEYYVLVPPKDFFLLCWPAVL